MAMSSSTGSITPVLISPSWAHTIVGPSPASSAWSSASGSIAPISSASTVSTQEPPRPSIRTARATVTCAAAPTAPRTHGAPCHTVPFDVPPVLVQDLVPCSGQTRQVRHLVAGHDRERGVPRQVERLEDPPPGSRLVRTPRGRRRTGRRSGPPRARHPVRGDRGRQSAADDEPEEAWRSGREHRVLADGEQLLEHRLRVEWLLGKVFGDPSGQDTWVDGRAHGRSSMPSRYAVAARAVIDSRSTISLTRPAWHVRVPDTSSVRPSPATSRCRVAIVAP